MPDSSPSSDTYYRAALVTSSHPGNDLAGTIVAMSSSRDLEIDGELLGQICSRATDRFDISSYATGLRVGTLYVTPEGDVIGVAWEDTPTPYDHGDLHEPVTELPESIVPVEKFRDSASE